MLNADDIRRCECCGEPTKTTTGGGCVCDNFKCGIRKEMYTDEEREKSAIERVKVANFYNGTDPELLRNARNRVGISIDTAADIIGVTSAEYVEKENGRKPISQNEYVVLITLFHTMEETAKGQRCGKCRYYREVSAFATYGRCVIGETEEQVGVSRKACGKWRARENDRY